MAEGRHLIDKANWRSHPPARRRDFDAVPKRGWPFALDDGECFLFSPMMIDGVHDEEDRLCGASSWSLHTDRWSLRAEEGGGRTATIDNVVARDDDDGRRHHPPLNDFHRERTQYQNDSHLERTRHPDDSHRERTHAPAHPQKRNYFHHPPNVEGGLRG